MLNAEPSRQKICSSQGVEQALVQYLLERQEWSAPRFSSTFWDARFPGAKITALQNILSKLSSDGAIIHVIGKLLPDELILRPKDSMTDSAVPQVASNNATARFLPTVATLQRYARNATPGEQAVYAWALEEVSRVTRVLESNDTVRSMVKTNVPNESRRVVEQVTDRLFPDVAFRLNMTRQSVHAAVLISMRDLSPALPLSAQDERLIEKSVWGYLQRLAHREVRSEFATLRVPTWPKIQL